MADVQRAADRRRRRVDRNRRRRGSRRGRTGRRRRLPARHPLRFEAFEGGFLGKVQTRGSSASMVSTTRTSRDRIQTIGESASWRQFTDYLMDALIRSISSRTSRSAISDDRLAERRASESRSSTRRVIARSSSALTAAVDDGGGGPCGACRHAPPCSAASSAAKASASGGSGGGLVSATGCMRRGAAGAAASDATNASRCSRDGCRQARVRQSPRCSIGARHRSETTPRQAHAPASVRRQRARQALVRRACQRRQRLNLRQRSGQRDPAPLPCAR